jgi:hypothetical protein
MFGKLVILRTENGEVMEELPSRALCLLKRKTIHGHESDEYKRDPVCENLNPVLDVGNFSLPSGIHGEYTTYSIFPALCLILLI